MHVDFRPGHAEVRGQILLHERVPSTLAEKSRLVDSILGSLRAGQLVCGSEEVFRCRLCLDEVIQNAVEHGNRGDSAKSIEVTVFTEGSGWGLIVTDEGGGFGPDDVPTVDTPESLLRERGRGLWILSEYMDEVAYYDNGRSALIVRR